MRWFLIASILAVEACIVTLVLQGLVRSLSVWIRWPAWIALLGVTFIVASATYERTSGNSTPSSAAHAEQNFFNFNAPYPTYRLLAVSSVAGIPVLLFTLGMLSLLRCQDGGLQIVAWKVSPRSCFVALGLASASLIASLVLNDMVIRHQILARDQEAQALSLLAAPPPCSDEENAAFVYVRAEVHTEKGLPDFSDDIELLRSEGWTEYLKQHATLAQTLREAAALPRCRFETDWSRPNVLDEFPGISQMRNCVRLLHREGKRALLDGDTDLGLENAIALRRMAEHASEDPRVIAQVVARAADGVATDLIEHFVYLRRPTKDEIARLSSPGFEFRSALTATCNREQAERYHMLAQAYLGLDLDVSELDSVAFRAAYPLSLAWHRLLYAGDDLRALPIVFGGLKRHSAMRYDELLESNDSHWDLADNVGGGQVADSFNPIPAIITSQCRADMQRRLADFALNMAERGLVERALHEGPEIAVPEADRPVDLFSGKPVRVIVADGGVIVYSVDIFEGDNGGSDKDMTFCFGEAFKNRRLTPRSNAMAEAPESDFDSEE